MMSAVITADADSATDSSRGGKEILGKRIGFPFLVPCQFVFSVWFLWTEKLMTEKWGQPWVPKRPFFCHQFFCLVSDPWIPDRLPHDPFLSQAGTACPIADRRQVEGCERWKMR